MSRTSFLMFFCLMSFVCCESGRDWLSEFPETDTVTLSDITWIDIPEMYIGTPQIMASFGHYILWTDSNNHDYPFLVYDTCSDTISTPVRKGRSDEEVLNVNQILTIENGFAIADNFRKRLMFYTESGDGLRFVMDRTIPIDGFSTVCVTQKDTVIGNLTNDIYRYGIKCASGENIQKFGDYSAYEFDAESGWGIVQGHMCLDKERGRIANFSYYICAYEIADYRKRSVVSSSLLEDSYYVEKDGSSAMSADSRLGFVALTSGKDAIYALYDGKPLFHYMENRGQKPYGYDILMFDWDGNYLKRIKLTNPVSSIAWNEDEQSLYASILLDSGEYRLGKIL